MPSCKKPEAFRFIILFMLMNLSLCPTLLHAELSEARITELNDGFVVENAELTAEETDYLLDADIEFHFSKEALKALEHGIPLQIDIEMVIRQSRKWLWDKTIQEASLNLRLEHHPLSNQFLITDLNTGIKRHFQRLQNALEFLGTIKRYPFLARSALDKNKSYTAQVRARLNTESLPAPLRLTAYIASDWRLSSPWFKWIIKQ